MILHPASRLPVADPNMLHSCFTNVAVRSDTTLFDDFILSASGFRAIFALSGDEEDANTQISPKKGLEAAIIAQSFASFLIKESKITNPTLIVGIDTRPTGPQIADIMIRVFMANGIKIRYAHVTAAPEIMAYTKQEALLPSDHENHADAFCYVSASHNPQGHNGLKFGLGDGGVLSGESAKIVISSIKELAKDTKAIDLLCAKVEDLDRKALGLVFSTVGTEKRKAFSAYLLFTREVVSATDDITEQEAFFDTLEAALQKNPIGVIAEMNGSARSLSIDADFLEICGVKVQAHNTTPGVFVHRIVPEGESLSLAATLLEEAHAKDSSFIFAYVPDCDGDRGNIVIWDEKLQKARALEAQETFALSVLSELASLARSGVFDYDKDNNARAKVAIAVNDPTSMRIDEIAQAFDAAVYRAEVGEANVVNLARKLRDEGQTVRILGEGSNGGNITYPASVRDPINTLFALIKLLTIKDDPLMSGLFHIWLERSNQSSTYKKDFTLQDVCASLPIYTTTSVFEKRAGLEIKNRNHAELKMHFQNEFTKAWFEKKDELYKLFGFKTAEAIGYNGIKENKNLSDFSSSLSGGLKILFRNENELPLAFIWLRPSGTEAVCRVLADVKGDAVKTEAYLLDWLKELLTKADLFESAEC